MATLVNLKNDLKKISDPRRAKICRRFFKTGKGEYAEGDRFLGLTVPQVRIIAKKYSFLSLPEIKKSLVSKIHEERQAALFILVDKFQKGDEKVKKEIFDLYCQFAECVNNWDLVDCSADKIMGAWLWRHSGKKILFSFARSSNLWKRRISIMATFYFIKNNFFGTTFKIAEILLPDSHDLIHKAVGWMLREVGKKDLKKEEEFLKRFCMKMPRTMLRYAIEKFPKGKRMKYLNGDI